MKKPVRRLLLLVISAVSLAACNMNSPSAAQNPAEVESMVSRYYSAIGAYDYEKMRAMYSPEFEIFDDGQRLDASGFEALVRGLEQRKLTWQFAIEGFDTTIIGDVAYTNYVITSPPDRKWFGTAFLKRLDGAWGFDHMVMMTERRQTPPAAEQPAGNAAGE